MSRSMGEDHTKRLVSYASALRYEDIPPDVLRAAKNTIVDGVGACIFGYRFPWSGAVLRYACAMGGAGGRSAVLGPGAPDLHPPFAALVNGALAHSFELDAGTRKGVGAHPFGTVFTAALPVAQHVGATGRDLLTAFVAGSETLLRIGKATMRSNEHRGFHAPGTTGPFGAAIACGRLFGLTKEQMLNGVGIAGSLSSGLRQFSASETGGMVKRLHFGRAAESGVLAASLAREGFDGPHDILEGDAGFLRVFCDEFDASQLVLGLDCDVFHMREISMKHFATHGSTQNPLRALTRLLREAQIAAPDIQRIELVASTESIEHHENRAPTDIMQAQYSIPFCMALACVRDASDPRSLDESALSDFAILRMLSRIDLRAETFDSKRSCRVVITTMNGVRHESEILDDARNWVLASDEQVFAKFRVLMRDCQTRMVDDLFERIVTLEDQPDLEWMRLR